MNLKSSFACLLFVVAFGAGSVKAQAPFEVPENLVLNADSDYVKYEADIVAAAKWLEETDLDKETEKRTLVNNFVITWVTGSPTVNVNITKGIADLYEGNPILNVFLASYARYIIEHKGEKGKFKPTKAALQSMIAIYKKGIGIKKNKKMEKVMKMNDEDLTDYIETEVGIDRED